jgi:hypothetical protein
MSARRDRTERRMRRLTGNSFALDALRDDLRRRRRRRRRRRAAAGSTVGRRRIFWAGAVIVVVLGAWAALDVLAARRDLVSARGQLSSAAASLGTATDTDAAAGLRTATRKAVADTARAESRLHRSPLLRVAGLVPLINTQRNGLYRAVAVAHDAAVIGDHLTGRVEALHGALTVRNASVDMGAVAQLAEAAHDAGRQLAALPHTRRPGQWSPLAHATHDLDGVLFDTARRLTHGADTMTVAHDLLGGAGPRRLLIALQNNAEMRDQGMVLSVALAEADNGSLRVTRSQSVTELELAAPVTDVGLPAGTSYAFGQLQPLKYWQSANATADTALAGATLRSMYKAATGTVIDGVVALDVPALANLLEVTGPVSVPGLGTVSKENAQRLLLNDQYVGQVNTSLRREQLSDVVAAVIARIQASSLNTTSLIRSLGDAAAGGHAWVTSADADNQRALERAGLSGRPGRVHANRTIHVAVQNGSGSKMDWFVDPKVDVNVSVTPDGTAVVRTKVTMPNTAPVPTPPSEQFGPYLPGDPPGLYRARVYFWGPTTGDQLNSVAESGLRLNFVTSEVPAGTTRSVEFSTAIPNAVRHGRLRLRFVPQPRARPIALTVEVSGLGWTVTPAGTGRREWDKTLEMAWQLHR